MLLKAIPFTISSFFFISQILATPPSDLDSTYPVDPLEFNINQSVPEAKKSIKTIQFTPPKGWRFAEATTLPASVKTLVVGTSDHEFPPSLNLGMETYPGTLKQYLKIVKEINAGKGYEWKDLGKIRTQAGDASLSQVDTQTEWGEVKLMHVMLKDEGVIYILTAAALKQEFPKFYKDFFNSLTSVHFSKEESYNENELHKNL